MNNKLARVALISLAFLGTGCSTLSVLEDSARQGHLKLDGLALAKRTSDTTREVVSMLALERLCRRPSSDCAERILDAPGTIRTGTRLIASSEILYRLATSVDGVAQHDAWLRCARQTHLYLHAPALPGRRGAMEARTQLVLRLHNACVAGLVGTVTSQRDPSAVTIRWDVDETDFPITAIQRVELAQHVSVRGLRTRQVDDGLGVAAIAIGRALGTTGTFPPQPFALAINVRFEIEGDGMEALVATDASRHQSVDTALGALTLARDTSAAYATAAVEFEKEISAWESLRGVAIDDNRSDIRLLAPIDDTKTPVILIHGFASSPMAWANVVNELLGDPDISEHYQFWLARYSTGQPILLNRQRLAESLTEFRAKASTMSAQPQKPAVLIGHSMGGVLARLLVTDPGDVLWNTAFTTSPDRMRAPPDVINSARNLLLFSPISDVDEVVFIAAPHGGSTIADGLFARILRGFVGTPARAPNFLTRLAQLNPNDIQPALRESYSQGGPKGVDTLSPQQPVIRAARALPVIKGVEIHSIVGIRNPRRPEDGDGVVPMESAVWPTGSEDRVEGGHDIHREPATIAVLKRILLNRLARRAQGHSR